MSDHDDEITETVTFEALREVSMGGVYVNVDFNDLLADHGEAKTFSLLGDLKDLFS